VTPGRRDVVVHAIVGRPACRCPRADVVQDKRAARGHVFASRIAGTMRWPNRTAIGSRASHVFPDGMSHSCIQISPSHHRAFHGGAVLSVVNALRFASTRQTAGPSGIDDASARHVSGTYAMVVGVPMGRRSLTRKSRGRMLLPSRQRRTAHPPFAATANGARIRSPHTGHGIERIPHYATVVAPPETVRVLRACEL
jgi:hypothetical protein